MVTSWMMRTVRGILSDENTEMARRMVWTLRCILSDESESSRSVTRKISLTNKASYIFVTFTSIALSSECPQKDGQEAD